MSQKRSTPGGRNHERPSEGKKAKLMLIEPRRSLVDHTIRTVRKKGRRMRATLGRKGPPLPKLDSEPEEEHPEADAAPALPVDVLEEVGGCPEDDEWDDVSDTNEPLLGQKNTTASQLTAWFDHGDEYLAEIIRQEAPDNGTTGDVCSECGIDIGGCYRCLDCSGGFMLCQDCLLSGHRRNPLHIIQEWNGKFFKRVTLKSLGLRVQLGGKHSTADGLCAVPKKGHQDFLVFDVNGVHQVAVLFCDCSQRTPRATQILRERWFPATYDRPRTAFTFRVLDMFQTQNLQSKISAYDFYASIMRLYDTSRVSKTVFRYQEFLHCARVWVFLMSLKRSGRGHREGGIAGTQRGELALECPACPHPGRNLPADWDQGTPEQKFIYTLFLFLDANFKLKCKARQRQGKLLGPGLELGEGTSYFAPSTEYAQHAKVHSGSGEINQCHSDHDAIAHANTSVPGYAVNGLGLVTCRHALIRANSVVDLDKGEKYMSMDFALLSTLRLGTMPKVLLSYDIGCQYGKKLEQRAAGYDESLHVPKNVEIEVAIPSWHVNGHGRDCQLNLSLSYTPGAGRTVGEDVETPWAQTNALAPSTREMGLGSRRNLLNDQWGGWNQQKVVGLCVLLFRRFKEAATIRKEKMKTYEEMTSTFPEKTVATWMNMVRMWKADRKKPNPYDDEGMLRTTFHDVRLDLAKGDASSTAEYPTAKTAKWTQTGLLVRGFELEVQQRTLRARVTQAKTSRMPNKRATAKQQADLQEHRNLFGRRLSNWREAQISYMPVIATCLGSGEREVDGTESESISLYLPSGVPEELSEDKAVQSFASKEAKLRIAQADDALACIRRTRGTIVGLTDFKRKNISGTGNKPTTRARSMHDGLMGRIRTAAQTYRHAYACLNVFAERYKWDIPACFRELRDEDIRGPSRDPEHEKSRGRYEPSWIWTVQRGAQQATGATKEGDIDSDCLRAEWAQVMARMERWNEEYHLVQEEMRHTVKFFEWKAGWWQAIVREREVSDVVLGIGLVAYAERQASILDEMKHRCLVLWYDTLAAEGDQERNPWWLEYQEEVRVRLDGGEGDLITIDEGLEDEEEQNEDDNDAESGEGVYIPN